MQRDPNLYRRTEFGWFLGALTVGTTVAAVLPVAWWLKPVLGVVFAFALLPLLGWLSAPLGRMLRFLLVPVLPLPPARWTGNRMTVGEGGASAADPAASRVVIEFAPGDLHTHYVLPPGADPLPAFRETIKTVNPNVQSVRAMKGLDEVRRWRPSMATRIARAWRLARSTERSAA